MAYLEYLKGRLGTQSDCSGCRKKMLKNAAGNAPLEQGNGLGGPLTESLGYHTEDHILLDGDAWDRLPLGDVDRLAYFPP